VRHVTDMGSMLRLAQQFNQDLSDWCVSQVASNKRTNFGGSHASFTDDRQPQWDSISKTCPPRVKSARLENTLTSATATIALDGSSENIAVDENTVIVVEFQEDINLGSGEISILRSGFRTSILVTDGSQVTVINAKVTIDPTSDLESGDSYTIELPAGIFSDADTDGEVNEAVTFSFTTAGG